MIETFLQGLGTGAGLIIAIGAQNAFVLAQGIRRQYHLAIALLCIGIDAILITIGVGGFGRAVAANPIVMTWGTGLGAVFLGAYGFFALCSAFRGGTLAGGKAVISSRKAALSTTLAVSLLNPHVYLDTVVLLGSVSSRFTGGACVAFWAGAVSASTLWFFTLSLGGQLLAPYFTKTKAWRVLDCLVCGIMWTIALTMLRSL